MPAHNIFNPPFGDVLFRSGHCICSFLQYITCFHITSSGMSAKAIFTCNGNCDCVTLLSFSLYSSCTSN